MRTRGASGAGYGAIGGAASAALTPLTLGAIDPGHDPLTTAQTAFATAVSMLAGGATAAALGQNANAGATAAGNEALNNGTQHWLAAIICVFCNYGPLQDANPNTIEDPTGNMVDIEDVEAINKGNEFNPVPSSPFTQNPSGK